MISTKKLIKLLLKGYTIETKDKDILYFDKNSKKRPFKLFLIKTKTEIDFNWKDTEILNLKSLLKNGDLSKNGLSKKLKKLVKTNLKKVIKSKYTHSVQVHVGSSNIVTLDAFINDKDDTKIKAQYINGLGIDNISLSLLERIIKGTLKNNFINKQREKIEIEKIEIEINEGDIIKNITKYQELFEKKFYTSKVIIQKL